MPNFYQFGQFVKCQNYRPPWLEDHLFRGPTANWNGLAHWHKCICDGHFAWHWARCSWRPTWPSLYLDTPVFVMGRSAGTFCRVWHLTQIRNLGNKTIRGQKRVIIRNPSETDRTVTRVSVSGYTLSPVSAAMFGSVLQKICLFSRKSIRSIPID